MRIAIDIRALTDERMTGVGVYTKNLVEVLAADNPDDEFVVFASGSASILGHLPKLKGSNITCVTLPLPNRLLSLLMLLPGGPTLEHFLPQKPDVWVFPKFNIFKTALPYFLTVHDLAFVHFPRFITLKERIYHRIIKSREQVARAEGILAVSASTAQDLEHTWHIPHAKIHVTPLGVTHEIFTPREQPSDKTYRATYDLNRPYILALATREPRKNLESVIEAYVAFRSQGGEKLPLVLSGTLGWKTSALHRLIADSGHQNDILVLGYVPEKHKPALYRGAICFVFPSFYEGFGLPVAEAMACGTPVITSATSSLPEVAQTAAMLIDPFNVNDLTAALHQLLNHEHSQNLRKQLSNKGAAIAQIFTWHRTAIKTREALNTLTKLN
ncbi:MAG TPA: glycosyltransferase family 1 protein [bacterium]|nr:glycosyltransferase family 1 protein [bacterium]